MPSTVEVTHHNTKTPDELLVFRTPAGLDVYFDRRYDFADTRERLAAMFNWTERRDTRATHDENLAKHRKALLTLVRFMKDLRTMPNEVVAGFGNKYHHHWKLPEFMVNPALGTKQHDQSELTRWAQYSSSSCALFMDWCERVLRRMGWESAQAFKDAFWDFGPDQESSDVVRKVLSSSGSSSRFLGLLL